jgi:hypothetical protein
MDGDHIKSDIVNTKDFSLRLMRRYRPLILAMKRSMIPRKDETSHYLYITSEKSRTFANVRIVPEKIQRLPSPNNTLSAH